MKLVFHCTEWKYEVMKTVRFLEDVTVVSSWGSRKIKMYMWKINKNYTKNRGKCPWVEEISTSVNLKDPPKSKLNW